MSSAIYVKVEVSMKEFLATQEVAASMHSGQLPNLSINPNEHRDLVYTVYARTSITCYAIRPYFLPVNLSLRAGLERPTTRVASITVRRTAGNGRCLYDVRDEDRAMCTNDTENE